MYSKTFDTPQFSNIDTTLNTGLTNISQYIKKEGMLFRGDGANRWYDIENGLINEINIDSNNDIHFSTNTQYATFISGHITLYYTKTTD